jgi:hypothetical protein
MAISKPPPPSVQPTAELRLVRRFVFRVGPKRFASFDCPTGRPHGPSRLPLRSLQLLPSKSWTQNYFLTSGRKSTRLNRPFPTTFLLVAKGFWDVFNNFVISKFFASWGAQTLQKLWPSKSLASNYFQTSERKSLCKSQPFSTTPTSGGPFHGCLGPKRPARFSLA